MAKKKEIAIIENFKILGEGIKLYLQNLDKFMLYMSFPVLGQIIGIILIFATEHIFVVNYEKIIGAVPALDNVSLMMLLLLLLIIPSSMLFFASFWKYLVAMGALNSMANNLISDAKLEDLNIHNDTVTRRMPTYLGLLMIISLISLVLCNPFLIVILLILMVYLCLVFQIFALEENLNAVEICKKSMKMVKGNFGKTLFILIMLYLITYNFLPELINFVFTKADLYRFLSKPIEIFCNDLPFAETQQTIQNMLTPVIPGFTFELAVPKIAQEITAVIISSIIIGYTLPLRSICCTLLYKNLETKKLKEKKIKEL